MRARPIAEQLDALPPERRAAIEAAAAAIQAEAEGIAIVREMLQKTRAELAARMGTDQASVSRLEKRTDLYVRTLREILQAMGGQLEILARFPGKDPVVIRHFDGGAVEPAMLPGQESA